LILWFLLSLVGGLGCLIFGIMLVFEGLSAAKYRADGREVYGMMKAEVKRSTKGALKLFLISLAVFIGSLLLSTVCSTGRR